MNTKQKTLSELKHEAIVSAAKQAFLEQGIQSTSMDKIAELAQVSKRTVYNHFPSKEALVMHLISELWDKSMVTQAFDYQSGSPLEPQLIALLESEIELLGSQEYLDLVRVAFGHFLYHPEELKKAVEVLNDNETMLHRWIKSAVKDGKLKKMDFKLAVGQLHNLIKGGCFWPQWLQIKPELKPKQRQLLAKETAQLFLSHYQVK